MHHHILIRKITPADNDALASIIRNSLLELNANKPGSVYFDEATDHLSKVFAADNSAYFVLEINGEVAGGSGLFPTEGLQSDTCELVKMYLKKEHRGNGNGQMLLDTCLSAAKVFGYKNMYLETMPELKGAIAMYQKNNFKQIPAAIGNSGHYGCDIFMMKAL